MSAADLWDVDEYVEVHPALKLRAKLIERGRKRARPVLSDSTRNVYVVLGQDAFSDSRATYNVIWDGHRWHCTCMEGLGAEYRSRGCSHVGAVIVEITERGGPDPWGITGEWSPDEVEADEAVVVQRAVPAPTPSIAPPSDPVWGDPLWPSWVEGFRPHQQQAYLEVIEAFESGAKVVVLDAPTGSGKTLLAEMIRRGLGLRGMNFTCTTKSLQEQVLRDFNYARMLQGRANYPTANYPERFKQGEWDGVNCGDCEAKGPQDACSLCPGVGECPYVKARGAAVEAPIAVLNSAYLLREWQGERSRFHNRTGLTVIDEADELESALMGLVEVAISPRQQARLRIAPPERKTVEESWAEWCRRAIPAITDMIQALRTRAGEDVKVRRELKFYEGLRSNVELMAGELGEGLWVYDGVGKGEDGWIRFKPVKVDRYGQDLVWSNDERFLLMSASIVSAEQTVEGDLGLGADEWAEVRVPNTFPPENRPIYPTPVANVTHKNRDEAYPVVARAVKAILDRHPDERVLVHTVSYDLTQMLFSALAMGSDPDRRPVFAYTNAAGRNEALEKYLANERAVLLAPSFERGIDLPDDKCRVMVIAKVPFPYLGDKQVSARLHSKGGQQWYRVQTVRSIVQMTGRGVRHEQDTAITYIIDGQFLSNVWKQSRTLFPKWWREAVVMDGHVHKEIKRGMTS